MNPKFVGSTTKDMKRRGSVGFQKAKGNKIKPGIKLKGISNKLKNSYMGG